MKKVLLSITAAICSLTAMAQEQAPAFPGAEGHGRYVTGGRASDGSTKVYHVTTLEDDTNGNIQGSLRWALKQSGPRTIVFDVSGYIDLKKALSIPSNTTIAGQTAPYPGITLRYFTLANDGNNYSNIIIRFLRIRRSQVKDVNDSADAIWFRKENGIIIDHCSFSWSIDEVASCYDNADFTMQWCTIAESLTNPGHSKGAHGYGGIWGGKLASFHHNLIAHVTNRAPRFNGARYQWTGYSKSMYKDQYNWENYVQAENVDLRNCVMYNYQSSNACYGGPGGGYVNIVNNYYKAGPSASSNKRVTQVTVGASGNSTPTELTGMTSRYFISGNYVTAAGKGKETNYDWTGVAYDSGTITVDGNHYSKDPDHMYGDTATYVTHTDGVDYVKIKLDSPCPFGIVTTHTAEAAFEKVLSYGGASLFRDAADTRYMEEVTTGTATYTGPVTKKAGQLDYINDPDGDQNDTYPSFPELTSQSRPANFDSDNDGMPDEWEQLNGGDLAPNEYTLDSKGWYSNLEVYMNSLVEDIMKAGNTDAESTIDDYYPACVKIDTGINNAFMSSAIISTEYYTLDGIRLDRPQKGIMLRVERMSNGKTVTSKVIK